MKPVGGYFELELTKGNTTYHNTIALKSGRAALHWILKNVKAKNVYIPFYTCNALLEAFTASAINYQFYGINENLDPISLPKLNEDDYFLYINYFDLKRNTVNFLTEKYMDKLIVDHSQAFFAMSNQQSWCFNSCRKFFGVPDGAYLYAPHERSIEVSLERNSKYTVEHLIKRLEGKTEEGYSFFQDNETLCDAELLQISAFSERMLSTIDFDACIQKRKQNFSILHQALGSNNLFNWSDNNDHVPMAYPFLPAMKFFHNYFWEQQLFVPVLWKDVVDRKEEGYLFEKKLASNLLPLPIDQRYDGEDMERIIKAIKSF